MTDDLLTRMRSASSLGAAIKALDEGADEIERLRAALKQFADCDLNDSNCSGLPVAVARIRNIARAALGDRHE